MSDRKNSMVHRALQRQNLRKERDAAAAKQARTGTLQDAWSEWMRPFEEYKYRATQRMPNWYGDEGDLKDVPLLDVMREDPDLNPYLRQILRWTVTPEHEKSR